MKFTLLLLIGCLTAPVALGAPAPNQQGKDVINLAFAAGTALLPNPTNPNQLDLVINTFDPTPSTTDEIYVVRDVIGQLQDDGNNGLVTEVLAEGLIWPSTVEAVPWDVFKSNDYYFTPGGFLRPTKDIGSITLIDAASQEYPASTIDLTQKKNPDTVWFKNAIFIDVDHDGRKDILAGRTNSTNIRDIKTALVWFKQPKKDPLLRTPWKESVLFEDAGPNFQYHVFEMSPSVTRHALFTTQLFSRSIEVHWNDVIDDSSENTDDDSDEDGAFENEVKKKYDDRDNDDDDDDDDDNDDNDNDAPNFFELTRRIIENEGGNMYFDSLIDDINGDGRLDIVATISSTTNGKLVAFEIPDDWENGEWTQHVLAEGFKPPEPNPRPGRGSPGRAQVFFPDINQSRMKPFILMTGDDDGRVYVVKPLNDADPSDWSYKADVLFEAEGNTIGDLTYADVDGDGVKEVFVPMFNAGQVRIVPYKDIDLSSVFVQPAVNDFSSSYDGTL